jgi:hypothetical protein
MTVASQNIGKLHHYRDPQFNTEFNRIYDFLANVRFPGNSINGRKLEDGSTPETKLILPLTSEAGIRTDAEIIALADAEIVSDVPIRIQAYAYVRDEKTDGTHGGTFTAGAWRTRDLNTEVSDDDNIVSISSNQLTIVAGEFIIRAKTPAVGVFANQARFRNIDDSTTLFTGTNSFSPLPAAFNPIQSFSFIAGRFTLASDTTFELQHACQTTAVNVGFGSALNLFEVNTEIYAEVELWRIEA